MTSTVQALAREIRETWKPRSRTAHKGDYGRVLVLAGSRGMAGAACLAGAAALRAGAGLVTLGVPEAVYAATARRVPEVMVHPLPSTRQGSLSVRAEKKIQDLLKGQDVLACGPGLSRDPETARLIRKVVLAAVLPVVLDADGLNAFAGHLREIGKLAGRVVLTPHPGEFRRLFKEPAGQTGSERRVRAGSVSKKYGVTVVLKGAGTVVAQTGRVFVNPTGNPGLAKGGSGDVLTGVIAGLLAQGFDLWAGARFGVFLHGLAADLAVKKTGEASLTAGVLLEFLGPAILKVRGC